MSKKNQLISIFLSMLVLCLLGAVPAFSDSDSDSDSDGDCTLAGSWRAIVDGNPANVALFTFGEDQTTVSSISDSTASTGHGAWEEAGGSRSFTSKNQAFLFTPGGTLNVTLRDEIELSSDCDSYTSAFETELSLLDGTVVSVVTGSSAAQRITVD